MVKTSCDRTPKWPKREADMIVIIYTWKSEGCKKHLEEQQHFSPDREPAVNLVFFFFFFRRTLQYYKLPPRGDILTLSTSSSILLVSGTSGAFGTVTIIGVRVRPRVPIEAVFTTWGCVGGPEGHTNFEIQLFNSIVTNIKMSSSLAH